jgi:PAS domain S-box-containing protein
VTSGRRSLAGAAVALGLVLAVAWLSYRNTLELIATQRGIAHTHEVLETVEAAVGIMKDAEIAVHGYLVTGDEELARRPVLARPELIATLGRLADLLADNPEQQQRLAGFDAAIRAKIAYADDVMHGRRTRGLDADELSSRLDEGLRRIDEIRGLAAGLEQEERRLLDLRETAAHATTHRSLLVLAIGMVLGVVFLATVVVLLQREIVQRRTAEAQLRTSERRLTLALDASQMGLWDLDLRTDESHRTLRHDQIFGYDTLRPAWGREVFLTHLHPADREVEARAFAAAFATDDFKMEVRIIRCDGAVRWVTSQGRLFRDLAGEPLRLMGSVIDVTERREAEERLRERTLQLEAVNEALGSFTYSVSHDLRAPLRAINGYAHILVEDHGASLNDESRRVLDVICSNARQMGRLIDDLLAFSRLGRTELERATTDLATMARTVADELRRNEPDRQVAIEIGALPPAEVDGTMVRHVIANLVGNAWKFTRDRDDAVVRIGCIIHDEEPVYFVADNGAGFDMRYAGKLFGVFERLHHADQFEGTGVGLAIVQRVVQRHGGRVWAEGEVGRGATFYFTLPNGNGKGAHHGTDDGRDPVGRGQPDGRRAGSAGAAQA